MERKLVLELSNGKGLERQLPETETLTPHPLQCQDAVSEEGLS